MEKGRIEGIITDRDLLRCAAQQYDIQKCSNSSHMSSLVVSVPGQKDETVP
jgi:hypothetical protein